MAAKIKITPEGLSLMTAVSYAGYTAGFYGKEVYFTDGFAGDTQFLFQALGNMGAYARRSNFDKEVQIVVISDKIMTEPFTSVYSDFAAQLEEMFNQPNTPYLRLTYITEENLLTYILNRAKNSDDDDLKEFVKKYKESKPRKVGSKKIAHEKTTLFD